MMKRCFILAILFASSVSASAQSPEVWRKLHSRYDAVWTQTDDGIILVNRGGVWVTNPGVGKNGRYGYVDTLGREIVPPSYDNGNRFHNGFAVVGKSGKYGAIDRKGRIVVPVEWDDLGDFVCGVFVAQTDAGNAPRFSLVDTTGHVTPLEYDFCATEFSCGLAPAGFGEYEAPEPPPPGIVRTNPKKKFVGKYGFVTTGGRLRIPVQYDEARDFEDDGVAQVGIQGKYYVKWDFIDTTGRVVVPCSYYSVNGFRKDRALVSKVVAGGNLAFGYIDRKGQEVIPCQYDEATSFEYTNTWVGRDKDGEMAYTLINCNGIPVLEYEVYRLQDGGKYGHAVAARPDPSGLLRFGILNNAGRILVPFEYDIITIFSDLDPNTGETLVRAIAMKDGCEYRLDISVRRKAQ